jgi:uncharacterized protein (DUF58 family)
MIPLPSRRLLGMGTAVAAASLAALVFPSAGLALLVVDAAFVLAALLDWLVTPGPDAVEVARLVPERMSVLGDHVVTLQVRNRGRLPLFVRVRDTPPRVFRADQDERSGTVPGQGESRWEYHIRPLTRGRFSWGRLHVRYRSRFGLWERQKVIRQDAEAHVYPSLSDLDRYHLLARADRLDVLGIRRLRLRGGAWEFESLRDYAYGDDVRLIDWKATARRRKPIVRNQEAEKNQTVILLVDSGRLMNAEVDGVAKLDHAVNTALLLAHVALSRGDRVGLCTFSHKVHAWVAPRAHVAQNRLLMQTLYDLRGDFTETDHGRCLRLLESRHPKRALLVVLTDFVDAQTASEMIAHVQLAGRRHLVLFAALKDPFLERAARSRPGTPFEGFRKASAVELLHERREVLERIRQRGAFVVDVEPAGQTPPVLNRYLEITYRGLI